MATWTISIPDDVATALIEAHSAVYGYEPTIPDPDGGPNATMPNPMSPVGFWRECTAAHWAAVLKTHLANQAQSEQQAALLAALAAVDVQIEVAE